MLLLTDMRARLRRAAASCAAFLPRSGVAHGAAPWQSVRSHGVEKQPLSPGPRVGCGRRPRIFLVFVRSSGRWHRGKTMRGTGSIFSPSLVQFRAGPFARLKKSGSRF